MLSQYQPRTSPCHTLRLITYRCMPSSRIATTKLRVVFDDSARTTSGHSFNETLMTGPTLYPTLTDILVRFRVAISGDVSKRYRAIDLSPEDRNYHRFVWRADKSSPVQDFRVKRVTFGVTASPLDVCSRHHSCLAMSIIWCSTMSMNPFMWMTYWQEPPLLKMPSNCSNI